MSLAEQEETLAKQHQQTAENEIRGHPVVLELIQKHGAQIREIKILKNSVEE